MSQPVPPTGSSSFDDEPTVASSQMLHRAAANAAATLGMNSAGADDDHTALHSAGVTSRIPAVSPTLGTRKLFGDYELVREIARGGMGVVFEALQTALKRTVAVKMILAGEFASDEQIGRFFAEARSVAHLDHPNIVPVYEVGEQSGLHFFSMKLVDGGSLTAKIASFANRPKEAAELVEKVARAVHHAHQRGVLHRDLKPGNILIDAAGEPMVTDFGLAKVVADDSHMTRSDAVVGTPAYMAPEQARGVRNATTSTDIWAIGAILYHLLAGVPPFKAETAVQTLRLVTDTEPPTVRSKRPGVPRDLETVCLKCLQKDQGRRYPTAAALADDLRRFIAGEPVEARPVGRAERVWRWCRRNPGPAIASAVVAVAILATVAVLSTAVVMISKSRDNERALATDNARRADAEKVLRQRAQWEAADRLLDNAIHRYAQEDPAVGLLWLGRALGEAEGIGAADLSTAARRQIAGWSRAVHPLRSVCRQGLAGAKVERVALSPDGSRAFAVGGGQREVLAFDAATGVPAFKPIALSAEPTLLAVDPSGRRLLVATRDGRSAWFDARTGKPLALVPPPGQMTAVAFDRSGRTLLTADGDCTVAGWDVEAGKPTGTPFKLASRAVAVVLSDDGRTAAAATADGRVSAWAVADGTAGAPPVAIAVAGEGEPWALRLAGESDLVVVTAKSARRFDRRTGAQLATRKMPEAAGNAAVSRDGRRVVVGDGGSAATVIDLDAPPQLTAPLRHTGLLTALAFADDGNTVAAGSADGSVRVWAVRAGSGATAVATATSRASCAAYSPDGSVAAIGCQDGAVLLFDAATLRPGGRFDHDGRPVTCMAFSPDGRLLLTGGNDNAARLWDLPGRKPVGEPTRFDGPVAAVAFDRAGSTYLAAAANGRTADDVEVEGRVVVRRVAAGSTVGPPEVRRTGLRTAALSPDGRRVGIGGDDGSATLIDLTATTSAGVELRHDGGNVWAAAFSPDGRFVATAGGDGTARVWDATTGKPVCPPMVHRGEVLLVAWSPDGTRLATAGRESTVRVWDPATGKPTASVLLGSPANAVAFSPDGALLAAAGHDGSAVVAEAATGRQVGPPLRHATAAAAVAFHPAGDRVLVVSEAGVAWSVPTTPVPGSAADVGRWVRRTTGLQLDAAGAATVDEGKTP